MYNEQRLINVISIWFWF